jgi:hypothetical protein
MGQDRSVRATFKLEYQLTVIVSRSSGATGGGFVRLSSGGVTVGTCTMGQGQCDLRAPPGVVTLTAVNETCGTFVRWTFFSGEVRTENPTSFNLSTANAIGATFNGCP